MNSVSSSSKYDAYVASTEPLPALSGAQAKRLEHLVVLASKPGSRREAVSAAKADGFVMLQHLLTQRPELAVSQFSQLRKQTEVEFVAARFLDRPTMWHKVQLRKRLSDHTLGLLIAQARSAESERDLATMVHRFLVEDRPLDLFTSDELSAAALDFNSADLVALFKSLASNPDRFDRTIELFMTRLEARLAAKNPNGRLMSLYSRSTRAETVASLLDTLLDDPLVSAALPPQRHASLTKAMVLLLARSGVPGARLRAVGSRSERVELLRVYMEYTASSRIAEVTDLVAAVRKLGFSHTDARKMIHVDDDVTEMICEQGHAPAWCALFGPNPSPENLNARDMGLMIRHFVSSREIPTNVDILIASMLKTPNAAPLYSLDLASQLAAPSSFTDMDLWPAVQPAALVSTERSFRWALTTPGYLWDRRWKKMSEMPGWFRSDDWFRALAPEITGHALAEMLKMGSGSAVAVLDELCAGLEPDQISEMLGMLGSWSAAASGLRAMVGGPSMGTS